jgi:hypothetical protein
MGQREDNMSIGCGEQFSASRGQPAVARLSLALGTMGSETVAKSVRMNALVDSGPLGRLLHGVEYAPGINGDVWIPMGTFAGEQIRFRLRVGRAPVVA